MDGKEYLEQPWYECCGIGAHGRVLRLRREYPISRKVKNARTHAHAVPTSRANRAVVRRPFTSRNVANVDSSIVGNGKNPADLNGGRGWD